MISDQGFGRRLDATGQGTQGEVPPGVIAMQGPGIRPGHRIEEATVYDVAPTLAALLDLPMADDLTGRVLEGAFEPPAPSPDHVRRVASYGPKQPESPVTVSEELARSLEEELRAVGYVR